MLNIFASIGTEKFSSLDDVLDDRKALLRRNNCKLASQVIWFRFSLRRDFPPLWAAEFAALVADDLK